jgi:hypothetical protein
VIAKRGSLTRNERVWVKEEKIVTGIVRSKSPYSSSLQFFRLSSLSSPSISCQREEEGKGREDIEEGEGGEGYKNDTFAVFILARDALYQFSGTRGSKPASSAKFSKNFRLKNLSRYVAA